MPDTSATHNKLFRLNLRFLAKAENYFQAIL